MKTVWWTLMLVQVQVLVLDLDLVSGEEPPVCSSMGVRLRSFRIVTSPCNTTTLRESQLKSVQSWSLVLVLPVLQVLILVLALPSNLLALWIPVFRSKWLPSTWLLVNLTACDLLLLLALPFRAAYHFSGNHWALGEPLCRLVVALFYGNMYGSVLCLAFIAADRYVALVHPFGAKLFRSRRTSLCMVLATWLGVAGAMLPLLLTPQTFDLDEPRITTCHDALPQSDRDAVFLPYFLTLFSVCFAAPLAVVVFCHGAVLRTLLRDRERYGHAVRVTVLVLLVFAVCFVPSNVLLLLTYADDGADDGADGGADGGADAGGDRYAPYMLSLALSSFNAVLDPFIYYYISTEFRDKAKSALCCRRDNAVAESSSSSGQRSSSSQRSKVTLLSGSQPANQSTAV